MTFPLVSYDSSSDSESDTTPVVEARSKRSEPASATASTPSPKRKRGLLKLPSSFSTSSKTQSTLADLGGLINHQDPRDDPARHQGRTRSRPFVEGDYNAHIYVALPVPTTLRRTIDDINSYARTLCPGYAIHSVISPLSTTEVDKAQEQTPSADEEVITDKAAPAEPLHISLTHPLPLRHSQLITFRDDVQASLRKTKVGAPEGGLRLSLAGDVVGFVNGRRYGGEGHGGRAFLALRVTAGSKEIERLVSRAVNPILAKLHLPLYHSNPQFHASFAWALTDPPSATGVSSPLGADPNNTEDAPDNGSINHTPFSPDVLAAISEEYRRALMEAQPRGGWAVEHLELKIGKAVHILPL